MGIPVAHLVDMILDIVNLNKFRLRLDYYHLKKKPGFLAGFFALCTIRRFPLDRIGCPSPSNR